MSDGGWGVGVGEGLWEWPPISAAAGGLSGCLLGAPHLLPRIRVISRNFILFPKPALCPGPYSQQEASGPTLNPHALPLGPGTLWTSCQSSRDAAGTQQGQCPGKAQKEQGAGQGSRKAEGWLLSGDTPQPGPGPGAVFPGTRRLRAEPESIRARRLYLPSPARSVDSPRAAARHADQLSAAPCLAAGGRRCWGFLAGAAQPAGLSPRSKRFTAAPLNDFVSYS